MSTKFLHAYTILEITIVMSVIVVMMGLGITGLVSFKTNAEFNSAYTSLVTNIRTIQNRAKNSISEDSGTTPSDYYAIFFQTDTYHSYRCADHQSTLSCQKTVNLFQDTELREAIISIGDCNNILVQRLTGKIYTSEFTGDLNDSIITGAARKTPVSCQIRLVGGTGDDRIINFNLTTNQVSFE